MIFLHPSLAGKSEGDILAHIVGDARRRQRMALPPNTRPDAHVLLARELPKVEAKTRGDVDLLIIPPGEPHKAIAIQAKRIKVSEHAFLTGQPNGLGGLAEGVRQANLTADFGFHRVYLYILIVVDSRANNGGRLSYKGLTPKLRSVIGPALSPRDLHPRIGIVACDFVQPVDSEPFGDGTAGWSWERADTPVEQADAATGWVEEQLRLASDE